MEILPLGKREFKRTIRLIYHKNKFISPEMKIFMELLEKMVKSNDEIK